MSAKEITPSVVRRAITQGGLLFLRRPEIGYQIMRICPIQLAYDYKSQSYRASVEAGTITLQARHENATTAIALVWLEYDATVQRGDLNLVRGDVVQFHPKGAKEYNHYADEWGKVSASMRFEISKIAKSSRKCYLWCQEQKLGLVLTRQQCSLFLVKVVANV